jgi:hypothetical protein
MHSSISFVGNVVRPTVLRHVFEDLARFASAR